MSMLANCNTRPRRATLRTLGACIVAASLVRFAASANAHAVLLDQFPLQASVLSAAPSEIRLHFNEPVTPISVRVLGGNGQPIVAGDVVSMVDTTLHVRFPKNAQPGTYVVSYRILSEDSHPVSDSFVFSIGQPSDIAGANTTVAFADEKAWKNLADIARAIFYATLLLASGGALFVAQFAARIPGLVERNRFLVLLAAFFAGISAVTGVIINGALLRASSMQDFVELNVWRAGWQGSLRDTVVTTLLGLGLIGLAVTMPLQRSRSIALVAGAMVAVGGLALSGHAATAAPRWLMGPAVGVHALCAAYWIGALWPLRRHLASATPQQAAPAVSQFSKVAMATVSLLFVAGLAIAWVQVGRPRALVSTAYGQWLLVKAGLFALLLFVATINKWRYTPRLASGDRVSARRVPHRHWHRARHRCGDRDRGRDAGWLHASACPAGSAKQAICARRCAHRHFRACRRRRAHRSDRSRTRRRGQQRTDGNPARRARQRARRGGSRRVGRKRGTCHRTAREDPCGIPPGITPESMPSRCRSRVSGRSSSKPRSPISRNRDLMRKCRYDEPGNDPCGDWRFVETT